MCEIKFYALKSIEQGCKRRTLFTHLEHENKMEGEPQYYPMKLLYTQSKVYEHIMETYSAKAIEELPFGGISMFGERLRSEDVSSLIENLDALVLKHDITFESVNIPATYEHGGLKVKLNCDVKGTFGGDLALFYLNTTTQFSRENVYELVTLNEVATTSDGEYYRLIVLKLGNGEIREVLEKGDRNKDGSLKKNGVPPWDELLKEVDQRIENVSEVLEALESDPASFNVPTFGSCGTCPYHNVSLSVDGEAVICRGG